MEERGRTKRGSSREVFAIEFDPESGEVTQGGKKVALARRELVAAIRKALAADHTKASAIVDAFAEPIIIFGPDSTLEWSNAYAEFTFGAGNVVRGTPCHLLVCDKPEACSDCPVDTFANSPRNPGTVRMRRDLRTAEGFMQPFEMVLRRMPGSTDRRSTMVFLRDIGEQSAHELDLRERLRRHDLRLEVSDLLLSAGSTEELLSRFCERASNALDLCTVAVLLRTSNGWLVPAHVRHDGRVDEDNHRTVPPGNLGLKQVLAGGPATLVRDVDRSAGALGVAAVIERSPRAGSGSMVFAPLKGRSGEVLGALVVGRLEVDGFDQEDVELIETLAGRLGLAGCGVLNAESSARVARLQKAILALGEIMATRITDFGGAARSMIDILARETELPLLGSIVLDPRDDDLHLFVLYTKGRGYTKAPEGPFPLADCPFMRSIAERKDVAIAHPPALLPEERGDLLLARLLREEAGGVAFVPASVDGKVIGWFALGVPEPMWFSTPAEVEVLRSLAQQMRIGLSWIVSDGRVHALLDDLSGSKRPAD